MSVLCTFIDMLGPWNSFEEGMSLFFLSVVIFKSFMSKPAILSACGGFTTSLMVLSNLHFTMKYLSETSIKWLVSHGNCDEKVYCIVL
jgi:hypothetical protein